MATLDEWERLVERYKGDRVVCNCGHAYYTDPVWCGDYWIGKCQYGCQANQSFAKDDIAKRVLEELDRPRHGE